MDRYRPEIDGLRAVAIILVVLFHLSFTRFGLGGYIGVDVFFVISGYLITAHLRRDLHQGFSGIWEFYRRRVIRIFPALFAVYAACAIAELSLKFISQVQPFQHALLSSTLFSSNFYLMATTGYFDFRARSNPLIHTKSSSISFFRCSYTSSGASWR
jgi:peptidoglycan/LPS O-acetylase OafA/YrhL